MEIIDAMEAIAKEHAIEMLDAQRKKIADNIEAMAEKAAASTPPPVGSVAEALVAMVHDGAFQESMVQTFRFCAKFVRERKV
jgi:DNA-binding ferritin-like protein